MENKTILSINFLGIIVIAIVIISLVSPSDNQKQIIILRDSLEQANKSTLYYRTQYLKANGQLIEVKQKCVYCAD